MSFSRALVVVAISASPAIAAAQPSAEPAPLRLPMGSRVRVQMASAPGSWTKGILTSADSAGVSLIPEHAPPLGDNQLRLPTTSVSRLELMTGTKRHWLHGLVIGAAAGAALGFLAEVDPVACQYDDYNYSCSRGEAVGYTAAGGAMIGVLIGGLVTSQRWTPVALDALGPPAPRVSGVTPRLRALPRGGIELALAVGF
jgi:hypothetical protein